MFRATAALQKNLELREALAVGAERGKVAIDAASDILPELFTGAVSVEIHGSPHETRKSDGSIDPLHVSGTVYGEQSRPASFHAYPDGRVVFSKRYPEVNVRGAISLMSQMHSRNAQATSSAMQASAPSSQQPAHPLIWQVNNGTPEYWNGSQWIPAQWNPTYGGWRYFYNNAWYYYG